jgi:transposase-like protein
MVNEIARLSKSSVEIQREYHPKWTGYLTVDDKWINVKGIRQLSLVAVDFSGDAVHSELSVEHTQGVYDDFLVYVRDRLGYPFKAITTDFDQRLENAIKRVISPGIAHQQCLWHAEEIVKGLIEYPQTRRRYETLVREVEELKESLADRKQSLYNAHVRLEVLTTTLTVCTQEYREKECLLRQLHAIVFARQAQTSERRWKTFCRVYAQDYAPVVRFIASHWEKLLQHQHDAMIPKTTARAENMNRQLERRLKTIEAFQSPQTAFDYQNLYRNYLRFKPYTDCRGNRKRCNGYSPLQLCGATIMNPDWLANAIRNP